MSDNRADLPDLPGAGTGIEYWRDGLERRMPRWWELGWRERVLVRVRWRHNEVLEPDTVARFADGQFDLVVTRWHLIHVPSGEAKVRYVRELKRIGKAGLILEPTAPDKTGRVDWAQKGTYCLSWDDWARWYDLTPFVPKVAIPYTDVVYW